MQTRGYFYWPEPPANPRTEHQSEVGEELVMGLAFFSRRLQLSCSAPETPLHEPNDIQQAHSMAQSWGTISVPH